MENEMIPFFKYSLTPTLPEGEDDSLKQIIASSSEILIHTGKIRCVAENEMIPLFIHSLTPTQRAMELLVRIFWYQGIFHRIRRSEVIFRRIRSDILPFKSIGKNKKGIMKMIPL